MLLLLLIRVYLIFQNRWSLSIQRAITIHKLIYVIQITLIERRKKHYGKKSPCNSIGCCNTIHFPPSKYCDNLNASGMFFSAYLPRKEESTFHMSSKYFLNIYWEKKRMLKSIQSKKIGCDLLHCVQNWGTAAAFQI